MIHKSVSSPVRPIRVAYAVANCIAPDGSSRSTRPPICSTAGSSPPVAVYSTASMYCRGSAGDVLSAYGFIPVLLSPERVAGFHGNDEHLTIENFNMSVELTHEIVRRMAT